MIRISIGAQPTLAIGADWLDVEIPIRLDMSEADGKNLGSVQLTVMFDPARFAFVRERAGKVPGWQAVVNTSDAASGRLLIAGFATRGVRQSGTLHLISLRPLSSGEGAIEGVVDIAADENARRYRDDTAIEVRDLNAVIS